MNTRKLCGYAVDDTGTGLRDDTPKPRRSSTTPQWLIDSTVRWVDTHDVGSLLATLTRLEHGRGIPTG